MNEEGRKEISYQLVQGFKIPKSFSVERYLSTINYQPKDDDIFLVTYPRCGTTWIHQILYLIFHNGNPPKDGKELFLSCPFLEMLGAEAAANAIRPCALKVHLPYHLTPRNPTAKYIYVTRNPKDCCVSLYHFISKTTETSNITFDDFFENFITGEIAYEDYFDNVLSWYEHQNDPNILFLTYEEMKMDLSSAVCKLCNFLGKPHADITKDDAIMKKIIHYSSFDHMKANVNKGFGGLIDNPSDDKALAGLNEVWSKRGVVDKQFVRKGEVGDWQNHFSPEQNRRMTEKIQNKLKSTGLIDIWKKTGAM